MPVEAGFWSEGSKSSNESLDRGPGVGGEDLPKGACLRPLETSGLCRWRKSRSGTGVICRNSDRDLIVNTWGH